MEVRVRLFATLREAAGWSEKRIRLAPDATVETLLHALEAGESGLSLTNRTVYAAVNQVYAERATALADGDEVALFPPVSGGRPWASASGQGR